MTACRWLALTAAPVFRVERHRVTLPTVTRRRPLVLVLAAVAVVVYVGEGIGYERLSAKCHDSRHLNDPERGQEVFPGFGVVLWPLFLPFAPASCDPTSS